MQIPGPSSQGHISSRPPASVTATDSGSNRPYNNGSATVSFTAPVDTGKFPITSYTVTPSPTTSPSTFTGVSSPITIAGLASNTSYSCTIVANNSFGTSSSASSNSFTATTVPDAPSSVTATAYGYNQILLSWPSTANGGSTITSASVVATQSSGQAPTITLSNITATSAIATATWNTARTYTFTVALTNANGTGVASQSSNSIAGSDVVATVTGGTLTSDATYYYRKFTANGTLAVTSGYNINFDFYLVAGGGAGGNTGAYAYSSYGNGGGGAGGVIQNSFSTTTGSFPIVIGAGGIANSTTPTSGANSTFSTFTAIGGGFGGYTNSLNNNFGTDGASGGSGGGGGGTSVGNTNGVSMNSYYNYGGAGTSGQGNSGGQTLGYPSFYGIYDTTNNYVVYEAGGGAGGGGASSAGANGPQCQPAGAIRPSPPYTGAIGGNGGNGVQVWNTGNYVGGGGGGGNNVAVYGDGSTITAVFYDPSTSSTGYGGLGGGGNGYGGRLGTIINSTAGSVNTGGGGGGRGSVATATQSSYTQGSGQNGGSGVLWIRYLRSAVGG